MNRDDAILADPRKAAFQLLTIGFIVRLCLVITRPPRIGTDTVDYTTLAAQIYHWNFHAYSGLRVPGYSLIILLAGQNLCIVYAVQSLLGLAQALLIFSLILRSTKNTPIAFVGGLLVSLNMHLLLFEIDDDDGDLRGL